MNKASFCFSQEANRIPLLGFLRDGLLSLRSPGALFPAIAHPGLQVRPPGLCRGDFIQPIGSLLVQPGICTVCIVLHVTKCSPPCITFRRWKGAHEGYNIQAKLMVQRRHQRKKRCIRVAPMVVSNFRVFCMNQGGP